MNILPELEKSLPLVLKQIKHRFAEERSKIMPILEKYRWYTISDNEIGCSCAAVDSSFLTIESRIGYIYVIQGLAVSYSIRGGTAERIGLSTFSDIGFITVKPLKRQYITKRSIYKKVLTAYAYTLELESVLKLIKDGAHPCNVVLIDGSFISFAMNRCVREFEVRIEGVNNTCDIYELENKKTGYLESLSKYRHVVFLAKSSNAGFYTNGLYPDIYVLELAKLHRLNPYSAPGFLEPLVLDANKVLSKLSRGAGTGIDLITVTYVRLREGAPVYQITLPYEADLKTIEYLYGCLRRWSASGYPMPLEYAHRLSLLPRKRLLNSLMFLGVPISTGRELIEL